MRSLGVTPGHRTLRGRLLLVACSARKRAVRGPVPARDLYLGTVFRLAVRFADRHGMRLVILSAKYGFIDGLRRIAPYDQTLRGPYDGPYPDGEGFYVGSDRYFGNAPPRFRRLIPRGLRIGEQAAFLKRQLARFTPPEGFA